jgi:hypothetical protein
MAWSSVDDLVFGIEGNGWVRDSESLESCIDKKRGIVDEVLGRHDCFRQAEE